MEATAGQRVMGFMLVSLIAGCSAPGNIRKDAAPPLRSPRAVIELPDPQPVAEPPSRTGNPLSYEVFGRRYHVNGTSEGYRERGLASWYGADFHGRPTSSGVPFDMYAISAAHKSLPIPTHVRVTNLGNGRSIVVRVNDRGPFVDDRIIDLSYAAAMKLDMVEDGVAEVEVAALAPYQYLAHYAPAPSALVRTAFHPAAAAAPAAAPAPLFLQVGAFSERSNAERMQSRLAHSLTHAVRVDAATDSLFKVRVGPLAGVAEADALMVRLAALGIDHSRIVFD
ncbi:MAG: septal ring lytic transglycosylase RlpA family protein [Pseudomonadota bacterium]|nr:septal ring lytic transglycosylase RlpA family protein [Pseudomonadota bacterium]